MCKLKIGVMSIIVTMGLIFETFNVYASSRYEQKAGYISNTYVVCEAGLESGYDAYAYVQASDYVDAYMDGMVYLETGEFDYVRGGFEQRTYGGIGRTFMCEIEFFDCYFSVSANNGDKSWFISVS